MVLLQLNVHLCCIWRRFKYVTDYNAEVLQLLIFTKFKIVLSCTSTTDKLAGPWLEGYINAYTYIFFCDYMSRSASITHGEFYLYYTLGRAPQRTTTYSMYI